MLSMKSLRVAFATIGSALLLLGPGFAAAQTTQTETNQHLDGTAAKGNAPTAVTYAAELLTTEITGATLKAVPVNSPDVLQNTPDDTVHRLIVTPRRLIDLDSSDTNNLYLRLSLGGGMSFADGLTEATGLWQVGNFIGSTQVAATTPDFDTQIFAGGGEGDTMAVFKATGTTDVGLSATITESGEDLDGNGETNDTLTIRNSIFINIPDELAIPAGNVGSYSATISAHRTADDAQDNRNPTGLVAGSANIVSVVEGIDASVCAAGTAGCGTDLKTVVADVGSPIAPFLWFKNPDPPPPQMSAAVLGVASAMAKELAGGVTLTNPDNGAVVADTDLIEPGSLTFTVEGDFSIGAFNLKAGDAACEDIAPGTADAPSKGNLAPAEDGPADMAELGGQNAGSYNLCVQVDTTGPEMNRMPIPATKYMGEITLGTGATALHLADGTIGDIKRNGTTVKLTYLTISSKYNQRLILVNDSASDATYSISGFSAEDGVMVTALDMAEGTIGAGEKMVIPVDEIVMISTPSGRQMRTAATLSINADSDDVQVATTQVNLEDGSTDTVLYATDGGVEVN